MSGEGAYTMATSAHATQTLSNITGYGLELCKVALERAKHDVNVAKKLLEKWHNTPTSNETKIFGAVTTYFDPKYNAAAIVEAQCDNEALTISKEFYELISNCIFEIVQHEHHYSSDWCIEELEKEHNCKIKINSARIVKSGPFSLLTTYSHRDQIGVIVETEVDNEEAFNNKEFRLFSFNCALHVAAFNPYSITKQSIPTQLQHDLVNQIQKDLLREGKAMPLWQMVIEGKLNKWTEQHTMLNQVFIKSDKDTVLEAKKKVEEKLGSEIKINNIARLSLGS